MALRYLAFAAALAFVLCGCAFEPSRSPRAPTPALLDHGCAPADPRIPELAARISALHDGEGFYAERAMKRAARDRDELVLRLVARAQALARCLPAGPSRTQHLWVSLAVAWALIDGRDPADLDHGVVAYDFSRPPRVFPFVNRACSGHGFEGAAQCLVLLLPAGLADIVTFPLGTWLWAGPDDRKWIRLRDQPLSPEAESAVLLEIARRRPELSQGAWLRPSTPRAAAR